MTINGDDMLHLPFKVGISKFGMATYVPMLISPNLLNTGCNVEFEVLENGLVIIEMYNIAGKKVFTDQNNLYEDELP